MASDQYVIDAFEKDSYCVTALYGDYGDETLSVHNYASQGIVTSCSHNIPINLSNTTTTNQVHMMEPLLTSSTVMRTKPIPTTTRES